MTARQLHFEGLRNLCRGAACRAGCLLGHASPLSTCGSDGGHKSTSTMESSMLPVELVLAKALHLLQLFVGSYVAPRKATKGARPRLLTELRGKISTCVVYTHAYAVCAGVHAYQDIFPNGPNTQMYMRTRKHTLVYIYMYCSSPSIHPSIHPPTHARTHACMRAFRN